MSFAIAVIAMAEQCCVIQLTINFKIALDSTFNHPHHCRGYVLVLFFHVDCCFNKVPAWIIISNHVQNVNKQIKFEEDIIHINVWDHSLNVRTNVTTIDDFQPAIEDVISREELNPSQKMAIAIVDRGKFWSLGERERERMIVFACCSAHNCVHHIANHVPLSSEFVTRSVHCAIVCTMQKDRTMFEMKSRNCTEYENAATNHVPCSQ